jgi:hypothetical protein
MFKRPKIFLVKVICLGHHRRVSIIVRMGYEYFEFSFVLIQKKEKVKTSKNISKMIVLFPK